jgi:hypothetical protein
MRAISALALCAALSTAPATIVAANNGYFDGPPPQPAVTGLAPDVQLPPAPPERITVPNVVVEAPAPKPVLRPVARGPRSCETRDLELYGSNVRVCGRPAAQITHRKRDASELAKYYR